MFSEISGRLPERLGDFVPGATFADRTTWSAVPAPLKERVLQDAMDALSRPWPVITASSYREFSQTGDRARFEDLYFSRRRMLNALVLGELVEGEGRFLPTIVDGIFLIAEESGWQLPAHNAYERGGPRLPLPDISRPVIDLFAAETAAQLATIAALLRNELDAISPEAVGRIEYEITRRIFTPYIEDHFWWMGRGDERMNNWTAWITQNVLLATFALPTDQVLRHRIAAKALGSLYAFLKDYADDGGCEEGVVYYRHAALCLHGAMTILETVAPGCFEALRSTTKIRNMAEYIVNLHVDGGYYFNFADSSAVIEPCSVREYLFAKAVGSEALASFAAADRLHAREPHLPEEWNLWYRIQELLVGPTIVSPPTAPGLPRDIFYEGIGLFIARDAHFALAVKAGHNGESHNHNDVGSITLYKGGRPFLIDVGVETYTAKTFSPRRYEIWTMQSAFHNLPTFGGVMQSDGAEFYARDLEVAFTPDEAHISFDIAGAYPETASLRSYRRSVSLVRDHYVEIIDVHDGDLPAVLSLMTCVRPLLTPGKIELAGQGDIVVEGGGEVTVEAIAVNDPRLRLAWPETIYRLRIPITDKQLKLQIFQGGE